MNIASFHVPWRSPWTSAKAHSGSNEVHAGLLRWALLSGTARGITLLADFPSNGFSPAPPLDAGQAWLALPDSLRDAVSVLPVTSSAESWRNIHLLTGRAHEAPGLILLRRSHGFRAPVSALVHSVFLQDFVQSYLSLALLCEECDRIVVPSQSARKSFAALMEEATELLQSARPGCKGPEPCGARVLVIPYGIEDDRFRNRDRGQARELLSISSDTVVFLWLGRLSLEYKADLHPLLRAFQSVLASEAGRDCLLILAGSAAPTNYAARLAQAARQLHLGERLRVMEDVSDLTRDLLYGAADVFVSPVDNIQESHGLAILEAMAAGLPVICSDWSGYRELVQHGVTGFLVPTLIPPGAFRPAEHLAVCAPSPHPERCLSATTVVDVAALARALSLLAGSEELRRDFGAKGRDRAQSGFRWSQVIHQFAASWREQVSEAEQLPSRPPFRIERAFSHYPGSPLNPSLTFVSTTESLLQDFAQVAIPGDPAARILTHCLGRVRSVSDLQRQFPEVQTTLLYALLKQGFLRIVSHASPHPTIPNA